MLRDESVARYTSFRVGGPAVYLVRPSNAASLREFVESLAPADRVVLLDVYAARERDTLGIGADDLAALMPARPLRAGTPDEAATLLLARHRAGELAPGAVVLTLGAGDVWRAGEGLLDGLRRADEAAQSP